MRLFIAINFNDAVKEFLCNIIKGLKEHGVKGQFSHRNNLHLTLVFIGESKRPDDIMNVMDSVKGQSFKMSVDGIGTFKRSSGHILWAGIHSGSMLYHIQSCLKETLLKNGFEIEDRIYKPHLTLGRKVILPNGFDSTAICPSCKINVRDISLMNSERIGGNLVYTEIYKRTLPVSNKECD